MKSKFPLRIKVIGLVIFAGVLFSFAGIWFSYRTYTHTINEHYKNMAQNIATASANTVNVELVKKIRKEVVERYEQIENKVSTAETGTREFNEYIAQFSDIEKSDTYQELRRELLSIQDAHDCQSVYLMAPYEKDSVFIFIGDASEDASMPGSFDNIREDQRYVFTNPEEGFLPFITNYEEYGWLCSTCVPVYDKDGTVIAQSFVDISMQSVMNDCHKYLERLLFIMGIITILLVVFYIWIVDKSVIMPINKVSTAAKNYMSQSDQEMQHNESYFKQLEIHTGDEIENLAQAMSMMEESINSYIDNLTKITAEKERIGAELSLATEIQASYLPNIFPPFPERTEFTLFASMRPAKEVGGDFYDFFLIDEDHLGLVIADVSGKGVPAALFMMISKTLIKNQAQFEQSPGKVLANVNKQLCENNEADMFVTVWLGILEISTGVLKTASAGHEYPAICRAEGNFELFKDKHGMPLGAFPGVKYREEEILLHKEDIIFVYTDGVAEATNPSEELFGTERMLETLNYCKEKDCEGIIHGIQKSIDTFVGEAPQFDDITMLVLKMNG